MGAAGLEPTTPGFGVVDGTSQGVADNSKPLEVQRVARGDLSRASPGVAPNSRSFGAIVVQENPVAGVSGSASTGPYLTVREVAARLRLSTATVYRLCESGGLGHARVSNAIRVTEADLCAFLHGGRSRQR